MEELAASNAAVSSELAAKGRQLRDLVSGWRDEGPADAVQHAVDFSGCIIQLACNTLGWKHSRVIRYRTSRVRSPRVFIESSEFRIV